jgi:hypothetical protein
MSIKRILLKVPFIYSPLKKLQNKFKGINIHKDGTGGLELEFLIEAFGEGGLVLEIGSFGGQTTRDLSKYNKIIAVDPFIADDSSGTLQGLYPSEVYTQFMENNKGGEVCLLPMTSEKALEFCKLFNLKLNGIFVDGLHTYEGVKKDVEWAKYLVDDGVIAFHDTNQEGVAEALAEFILDNPNYKFWKQEGSLKIYVKTKGGKD